jgi:hypothetical protein
MMVWEPGAERRYFDYVKTGYIGYMDFTLVLYPVTNNDLLTNTQVFYGGIVKVNHMWESG